MNHAADVNVNLAAPKPLKAGSTPSALWERPKRSTVIIPGLLCEIVLIGFLSIVLSGRAAVLVLDQPSLHFSYPFTIQNVMRVIFFIALGELFIRWRTAVREKNFLTGIFFQRTISACW